MSRSDWVPVRQYEDTYWLELMPPQWKDLIAMLDDDGMLPCEPKDVIEVTIRVRHKWGVE